MIMQEFIILKKIEIYIKESFKKLNNMDLIKFYKPHFKNYKYL